MDYKYLIFSKSNGLGRIAFNRPESLNSITIDVMRELDHASYTIDSDTSLGVLGLLGRKSGKRFYDYTVDSPKRFEYINPCLTGEEE